MTLVCRGGPYDGREQQDFGGSSLYYEVHADGQMTMAHYIVECVNGEPVYLQYVPEKRT